MHHPARSELFCVYYNKINRLVVFFPLHFGLTYYLLLLGRVQLFVTPWTAARQASLSFTVSRSLLKRTSMESMMPSDHLILCCPFSSCPQSLPASGSFPVSQLFASGGQSTISYKRHILISFLKYYLCWGNTGNNRG